MRRRYPPRARRRATLVAAATMALTGLALGPAGAVGLLPPVNPPANVTPTPNFLSSGTCSLVNAVFKCTNPCVRVSTVSGAPHLSFPSYVDAPACVDFLLRSLDAARGVEGLSPFALPSNWHSLSVPEQLFVVADLERVDRGLPPYLGLNRSLSASAQAAARTSRDPLVARRFPVARVAGGPAYGSTWASGLSPLEADFVWMYDDGWGGSQTPNLACTSPSAAGCWGHRDQLLGSDRRYNPGVGLGCTTCEMGAGFAVVRGTGGYADLVERPAGRPPAMYFTWARDVAPFLPS